MYEVRIGTLPVRTSACGRSRLLQRRGRVCSLRPSGMLESHIGRLGFVYTLSSTCMLGPRLEFGASILKFPRYVSWFQADSRDESDMCMYTQKKKFSQYLCFLIKSTILHISLSNCLHELYYRNFSFICSLRDK